MMVGEEIEPESRGWRPPVGWTAIGLGIVGLGLGTFFAIKASSTSSDMDGLKSKDQERYDELDDDLSDYQTGMIVSFSVGAALLLAGILILVWPTSSESPFRDVQSSDDGADGSTSPW